ncbi:hypothetical protein L596_000729 [Steinernema carpocapsae]|uniref:Uncharacterized protein n=1 Tax=Steinernema carpocapsae TaxID=34508 RepID=A0A4U8UJS1_STECR|nr:hypothetical protein L596_000729 [Steinernema carpocapsae]
MEKLSQNWKIQSPAAPHFAAPTSPPEICGEFLVACGCFLSRPSANISKLPLRKCLVDSSMQKKIRVWIATLKAMVVSRRSEAVPTCLYFRVRFSHLSAVGFGALMIGRRCLRN